MQDACMCIVPALAHCNLSATPYILLVAFKVWIYLKVWSIAQTVFTAPQRSLCLVTLPLVLTVPISSFTKRFSCLGVCLSIIQVYNCWYSIIQEHTNGMFIQNHWTTAAGNANFWSLHWFTELYNYLFIYDIFYCSEVAHTLRKLPND